MEEVTLQECPGMQVASCLISEPLPLTTAAYTLGRTLTGKILNGTFLRRLKTLLACFWKNALLKVTGEGRGGRYQWCTVTDLRRKGKVLLVCSWWYTFSWETQGANNMLLFHLNMWKERSVPCCPVVSKPIYIPQ